MKKIILAGTDKEPDRTELDNRALSRRAAVEGFVLLKNEGVLPLQSRKIALYGSGARMTVKGGTGSGAVRERYSVSIEEGLQNAGLTITTSDWLDRFDRYYADAYECYRQGVEEKVRGITDFYTVLDLAGQFHHPSGIPVTQEDIVHSETDTAIYVLARQAGEGNDRRDEKGDYRLEDVELENLRTVSGNYLHTIVIINAGGVIDTSFLDTMKIDALVYYAQGGEEGGNALADVLTGKENFSGRLTTGWMYDFTDSPSGSTYSYLGENEYEQEYNEGIYVGYRYADTFHVKPRFPFGYGLSYTRFRLCITDVTQSGENIRVTVTAENIGTCPGREVVQIYASLPFGTLGGEVRRLVAFTKTDPADPGETCELQMEIPISVLTRYREETAEFILEKGRYYLLTGESSEDVTAGGILDIGQETVTERCRNICPAQHAVNEIHPEVPEHREEGDLRGVKIAAQLAEHILKFDTGRICTVVHHYQCRNEDSTDTPEPEDHRLQELLRSMTAEQKVRLIVGGGTQGKENLVNALGASGTTTSQLYGTLGIPNVILSDGPAGLNLSSRIMVMEDGDIRATLCEENLQAYRRYLFGMAGMGMKRMMAQPGSGTEHYQYCTAWPCVELLAQTFNTELMEEVGDGTGREMEKYGVTVWLAPGMNIHRNPLCGRTFEYYSEDPVVSGKMTAAIVRGVQRHPGKGMSIKHFVANNCELNRNSSSSNMSERTLREIYLKGFRIAVEESDPRTVMASYNKVNGLHVVNHYDLLTSVLRDEWHYKGLIMSDWDSMKAQKDDPMKPLTGDVLMAPGAGLDLIMPGREDQIMALTEGVKKKIVKEKDLNRAAGNVLKLVMENTVVSV